LAVIGRQWLTVTDAAGKRRLDDPADFVRIEIEAALQRDIPSIPVLVQHAAMPGPRQLPSSLQSLAYRNGIAVRSDPDFHRDVDRLIQHLDSLVHAAMQQHVGAARPLSDEKTVEGAPPRAMPDRPPEPANRFTNSLGMQFVLVPRGSFWMGG